MILFINACSQPKKISVQPKIVDYVSLTKSASIDGKRSVIDVVYKGSEFDFIREQIIIDDKRDLSSAQDNRIEKVGVAIDKAQLIDYKSDTLYLLSTFYIPAGHIFTIIKTKKGVFDLNQKRSGDYNLSPIDNSYNRYNEEEKKSELLLQEAIFTWDIDLLVRIIKATGKVEGSEYSMSATRIILRNNQIIKRESVNFGMGMLWRLE